MLEGSGSPAGGPQSAVGSPLGTDGLQSHSLIIINWCLHALNRLQLSHHAICGYLPPLWYQVASQVPMMTPRSTWLLFNYCVFMPIDVDHLFHGRWQLLDHSLGSLTHSPLSMAFVAAFMNFITSAIGVIHYGRFWSDPIHLKVESVTIRFRSDNLPFSLCDELTVSCDSLWLLPLVLLDKYCTNFNEMTTPAQVGWTSVTGWLWWVDFVTGRDDCKSTARLWVERIATLAKWQTVTSRS